MQRPNHITASHTYGVTKVPTPRELVLQLDQWVVGQPHAKRVGALGSGFTSHRCRPHTQSYCHLLLPPLLPQVLAVATHNHYKRILQRQKQELAAKMQQADGQRVTDEQEVRGGGMSRRCAGVTEVRGGG